MHLQFIERVQIPYKEITIIQTKGDAIIAVSRGIENFSFDSKLLQKTSAFSCSQDPYLFVLNGMKVSVLFLHKDRIRSMKVFLLLIHHNDHRS